MPAINDPWQSARKLFALRASIQSPLGPKKGGTMSEISMIAVRAVPASTPADQSLATIALFSCIGLLVSVVLITFGIDLGPAWI